MWAAESKYSISEDRLTLTKALEIAQGMEAAEANMKKLQGSELTQVNMMQQSTKKSDSTQGGRWKPPEQCRDQEKDKSSEKPCYHCGLAGHSPSKCHYREAVYRKCLKTGHLAKVCRKRQPSMPSQHVNTVIDHEIRLDWQQVRFLTPKITSGGALNELLE